MLDRLPLSLRQFVLLEWLAPKAVCAVARAGSVVLRRTVRTSPVAFRGADGEVTSDACVRWFREKAMPLMLWTTIETKWDVSHYYNGKLHSNNDRPAKIWADGTQFWYQHGKLHRDGNRPAVIWANQHGEPHRDGNLPAYVAADGVPEWYQHNVLHCGGPARRHIRRWDAGMMESGTTTPALITADGTREW